MSSSSGEEDRAPNRMAALLLLSRGQAPSWRSGTSTARRRPQQQQQQQQQQQHSRTIHKNDDRKRPPPCTRSSRSNTAILLGCWWIAATGVKVLLFPAYRSTDFYVHRHWKAVARHLPAAEWYFDDRHVQTRHTVDYPPGFLLFWESLWGNAVVPLLLPWRSDDADNNCLALLDDDQLEAAIAPSCTAFLRTTVIVADLVWWLSAYALAAAVTATPHQPHQQRHRRQRFRWLLFGLLTGHPALLLLDHVHFQYNGLLLGLLMLSLACLMRANNNHNKNDNQQLSNDDGETRCHLGAAALFALLLTMKHLYITCSPWFVVYLARRYCCVEVVQSNSQNNNGNENNNSSTKIRVAWGRLFQLILCGGLVLVLPFAFFVGAIYWEQHGNGDNNQAFSESVRAWLRQLGARLFPFERGLVHDYWAANVWALYTAAVKAVRFVARRLVSSYTNVVDDWLDWFQYSAVTPTVTAAATLLAQISGWRLAWRAAARRSNALLLQSFTCVALVSFLLQYHAHEKAVLTALAPGTVWAVLRRVESDSGNGADETKDSGGDPSNGGGGSSSSSTKRSKQHAQDADAVWSFLWEFTALAVLGIFPLLFRPQELLLKLSAYLAYLGVLQYSSNEQRPVEKRRRTGAWIIILLTILQLECVPLQRVVYGRFEFAPLAVTSLVCASGVVLLAVELLLRTHFSL